MRTKFPSSCLLATLLFGTMGARAATTPPTPLHTPPLMTPLDAAGTGLAPEVSVQVTLDVTGRVRRVEVLSIRPSSDLDAVFELVTRETLLNWRYAPARRDGRPVETTMKWTVQFPPRIPQREGSVRIGAGLPAPVERFAWRGLAIADSTTRDRRRELLMLPYEKRRELLNEKLELARRHLHEKQIRKFTTPQFLVYTDAPDPKTGEILASNLEAVYATLDELLGDRMSVQPDLYRIVVVLFSSESAYHRAQTSVEGIEWAAGCYSPVGLILFHLEMPSNQALLSVMIHEATHAYLDRYIARPGVVLPRWLDEGFAEYVGNSQIRKGKLVPGKTRRVELYPGPWGVVRGTASTSRTLDQLKTAVHKGTAASLGELIEADRSTFYGEKRSTYYGTAWLLVHFLNQGEKGWDESKFPQLILYVAEGYPPLEAFRQIYGDPDEFDAAFKQYIRKF